MLTAPSKVICGKGKIIKTKHRHKERDIDLSFDQVFILNLIIIKIKFCFKNSQNQRYFELGNSS